MCSISKVNLGSSNITKLSILNLANTEYDVNLTRIDAHLLAESWSKLSVVDLRKTYLLPAQKTAIASHIISSKVKELNLSGLVRGDKPVSHGWPPRQSRLHSP